jgi:hypothetical protein
MSWEAQRLTSKSPSEVYAVLGPHGCDDLVRQAWAACWRAHPEEGRTYRAVRQRFFETFTRNLNIWKRIKKPTPEAFFADFVPHDPVEGYLRQAMVLSWMMMPRAGGRDFKHTVKIIQRLYDRNVTAWDEDDNTFSPTPRKPEKKAVKKAAKKAPKAVKKAPKKKQTKAR